VGVCGIYVCVLFFFFFFQAEDGIRDRNVTGVQTCALPISKREKLNDVYQSLISAINSYPNESPVDVLDNIKHGPGYSFERFESTLRSLDFQIEDYRNRSEERRVGKECR